MLRNVVALFRTPASRTVALVFALNSVLFGNWFVRIPAVQADLGLGEAELGLALLGLPAGSVVALPMAGRLIARYGAGPVTWWSTLALCLAFPAPAAAWSAWSLAAALVVLGVATAIMDVAMNAEAAAIETGSDLSLMSSFHAMFSLGGIAGAVLGSLAAGLGLGPLPHMAMASLAMVLVLLSRRGTLPAVAPPAPAEGTAPAPLFALPKGPLLGLALVCCATMLAEGSAMDWSAVYLASVLGAGPAMAGLGYAAFSAGATVGRLFGDGLRDRFGEARVVRDGALLAGLGLGAALLLGHPAAAVAGFTCLGLGLAGTVPILFRRAAATPGFAPGVGLAAVAGIGYAGFLAGPPVIGLVAEATGLGPALGVVAVLVLLVALLSGRVVGAAAPTPADASARPGAAIPVGTTERVS